MTATTRGTVDRSSGYVSFRSETAIKRSRRQAESIKRRSSFGHNTSGAVANLQHEPEILPAGVPGCGRLCLQGPTETHPVAEPH